MPAHVSSCAAERSVPAKPPKAPTMRLLRRRRRGMTLVEAGVALVVVAAAGLALVQLVALAARQQRAAEIRLLAVQEVANQAERVALRNWDEAAVGQATSWEPGPELAERARRPACRMTVTEEAGPPPARRILLQVDWLDAAGQRVSPVELTVWKFRREATP